MLSQVMVLAHQEAAETVRGLGFYKNLTSDEQVEAEEILLGAILEEEYANA